VDWLTRLEAPQNALAILTAMITPAVLIDDRLLYRPWRVRLVERRHCRRLGRRP